MASARGSWFRVVLLSRAKQVAYVALAYGVLTAGFTYPAVLHIGDRIIGDFSDHSLLSIWNLWWVKHALLTPGLNVFHTTHISYPDGVSLYFHTLVPLYGFLTIPVQLAFGVVVAHNLVILTSFVAAGLMAFLLVQCVVRNEWAAFIAGAAFTFSTYHIARAMGHNNLVLIEWLPLYALVLLKSANSKRYAALSGVCLFLIMLVDLHYLLYCVLLTGWFGLYRLWRIRNNRGGLLRQVMLLFVVGLTFVVIGWPVLIPMVREAQSSPTVYPNASETVFYSADLLSFFIPSQYQFLYGARFNSLRAKLSQGPFESQNFLAYTCLVMGLIGATVAWRKQRDAMVFWTGTVLGFLGLSLGPVLHIAGQTKFTEFQAMILLPYVFLYKLPFIGISRVVGRMSIMALLGSVVLSGFGMDAILSKAQAKKIGPVSLKLVVFALTLGLVLFENLPVPFLRSIPVVPPFYQRLASDPETYAVFDLPRPSQIGSREIYQFYQTVHGKKLSAGHHSRLLQTFPLQEMPLLAELAAEQVDPTPRNPYVLLPIAHLFRYVVLHKNMAGPVAELESALSNVRACYEDQLVRVYCPKPQRFQHPADFTLDGKIKLVGYELDADTVKPGNTLHLTLFWQASAKIELDYSVFTHLLDPHGHIHSQQDNYPQRGKHPTTRWTPGEIVPDSYVLPVSQDASAGEYQIEIGMYDWRTGERLPAFNSRGERLSEDRILLQSVRVVK